MQRATHIVKMNISAKEIFSLKSYGIEALITKVLAPAWLAAYRSRYDDDDDDDYDVLAVKETDANLAPYF